VCKKGNPVGEIRLSVPGIHNVYDALAAFAVSDYLGLDTDNVCDSLYRFSGTHRRFETRGIMGGIMVVDDYAHHPTEILGQITSIKKFFSKPVWVVFQPHTYSRTKTLFADFVSVLSKADKVFLLPTYSAREQFDEQGSSEELFSALKKNGANAQFLPNPQTAKQTVLKQVKNQVALVLGAGDINQFFA
jgi:UDP-N-acetylmuramate--alanine ligase